MLCFDPIQEFGIGWLVGKGYGRQVVAVCGCIIIIGGYLGIFSELAVAGWLE